MFAPEPADKIPPCQHGCPNGNDVRGWLALVAQRRRIGLDDAAALRAAWELLVAGNPFPATMGRICPHPCEAACSRGDKDGPVAIHLLERFLGDWALREGLSLPRVPGAPELESLGVVGGGPAGLSFAYQMARRGYRVTVYERTPRLGGMLLHGIPEYRLPERVLGAEIDRIVALGIDVRLDTTVGRDVSPDELRRRHAALFLGIGAGLGRRLGVPGEDGPGVWTGVGFLAALNRGERPAVGRSVVVVGGGNTAVDAARAARRLAARATIVYRRSRGEMPAGSDEVEEALAEGVELVTLAAPARILRENGAPAALEIHRMRLGGLDASGRRRPIPLPGATARIPADTVIAAVSQVPDWAALDGLRRDDVPVGGDARRLGIAGTAVAHGRQAAETVHRRLRGIDPEPAPDHRPATAPGDVKPEFYPDRAPVRPPTTAVDLRLTDPAREVVGTIGEEQFFSEVARCFSCGLCFGCRHCWNYCNGSGFTPVAEPRPGAYFVLASDRCEECGKCVDLCPCGYLSPAPDARRAT